MAKNQSGYTVALRYAARTGFPERDLSSLPNSRWQISANEDATVFSLHCTCLSEALRFAREKLAPNSAGLVGSTSIVYGTVGGQSELSATLRYAAALASAGHPGQLLFCPETAHHIRLSPSLDDPILLGTHVLEQDLPAVEVWQWNPQPIRNHFPPLRTLYRIRHNLPERNTPFFGRISEIEEIGDCLRTSRSITIFGAEGLGKSALAWRCGIEFAEDFTGGVWRLEVDPYDTLPSLSTKLESLMKGSLSPDRPEEVMGDCFLILDNCELAPTACRMAVEKFGRDLPNCRILATSEHAIEVNGVTQYPLRGLRYPEGNVKGVEEFLSYDAARLFWDRVLILDPEAEVTHSTIEEVSEICRQVGGSPAALIALAAPYLRLGIKGMQASAKRFAQNFPVFPILGSVVSTFHGLAESSQVALACLTVFAGDWTIPSAQAVAFSDCGEGVMSTIRDLIEAGLVEIKLTNDGEIRYIVSPFAATHISRLRSFESHREKAIEKHLHFYLELAESKPAEIERDMANIRLALSRALEQRHAEQGLRLVLALGQFWHRKGPHAEAADLCDRACQQAKDLTLPQLPRALNLLGTFRTFTGDLTAAALAHEEAFALSAGTGDLITVAMSIANLATVYKQRNETAVAKAMANLAVAAFRSLGDDKRLAMMLTNYGAILEDHSDFIGAANAFEESIAMFEKFGDELAASTARFNFAEMAMKGGRVEEARHLYLGSLQRAARAENPVLVALSLEGYSFTELARGSHALAALALGAAIAIRAKQGVVPSSTQSERIEKAKQELIDELGKTRLEVQIASARSLSLNETLELISTHLAKP